MRLLRTTLLYLALAITLAGLVAGLAFVPAIQTWFVERALARHPDLHVSVGSVSAGLSRAQITQLRIQRGTAVLTFPALDVALPVKAAWWDGHATIQSLQATGWTLDLSNPPSTTPRSSEVPSSSSTDDLAKEIARQFRGLLAEVKLPVDVSLDGANLTGEVLLPPVTGTDPIRLHAVLRGGGLAAGRSGDFALELSGPITTPAPSPPAIALRGQLTVTMNSPRTIQRIALESRLVTTDGTQTDELTLSAHLNAADSAHTENYAFDLRRGTRQLAALTAQRAADGPRLIGTWKLDLSDRDLSRLHPRQPLPSFTAAGAGNFETDPEFARIHANGRAQVSVSRFGSVAPNLERLAPVSAESEFALIRTGNSLHVESLTATLSTTHPVATLRSLQSFDCDLLTVALKAKDSSADWLKGSFVGLPLAWLSGLVDGVTFTGGDLTGDFSVTTRADRFALRARAPLTATDVSVQHRGKPLAQGLDVSVALLAEHTPEGWELQSAPLILSSAGRRLATLEAKVSPLRESRLRYAVAGKWDADLDALASQPALAGIGPRLGRSASGDLTIRVGQTTEISSNLKLLGHTPDHTVTANARTYFDAYEGVVFKIPLTITFGKTKSTISIDGQWSKEKSGPLIDVVAGGVDVDLAHLRLLAETFSAWRGFRWPTLARVASTAASVPPPERDPRPFWGDWTGRGRFDFYSVKSGPDELNEVSGILRLERNALRLEAGRAVLAGPRNVVFKRDAFGQTKGDAPRNRLTAEGTVSFDAAADLPYRLKATAGIDVIEAARLFTADQASHDPVIEGRFSLAAALSSEGRNVQQLIDARREEFRVTSKNGIVRLLKADVAASIPDDPTPVKDGLAKVGSLFGAVLGIRKDAIDTGLAKMGKATRAVLDLNYQIQEFHYDDLSLTATRGPDRGIELSAITLTTPLLRLSGAGKVAFAPDLPLRAQPLALDLKFGAKAHIAQFLTTAGLLSNEKDDQGYAFIPQPIHFGGTLEKVDNTPWRDLLVKAATPPSAESKKSR